MHLLGSGDMLHVACGRQGTCNTHTHSASTVLAAETLAKPLPVALGRLAVEAKQKQTHHRHGAKQFLSGTNWLDKIGNAGL
eukprot:393587-Alexandrium_andersonii.AAC.1